MKNINFIVLFYSLITLSLFSNISCTHKTVEFKITDQKQIALSQYIEEDNHITNIIKPYRDSLNYIMNQVIGFSDDVLASYKPESPLTNFISDILLEYGQNILLNNNLEKLPALAIVNSKGLRTVIPKGEVTVRNIYEVLPFENRLTILKLNGLQIQELCNHIVSEGGDGLAGATFTMAKNQANNIYINNQPLVENNYYWVIAPDYLAQGGDNYKILTQADKVIETDLKLRDIVIKKIKILNSDNTNLKSSKNSRISKQ